MIYTQDQIFAIAGILGFGIGFLFGWVVRSVLNFLGDPID